MSAKAADVAWMGELRERVQTRLRICEADEEARWNADPEKLSKDGSWCANRTRDYVDLIFAFAAARIGEQEESRRLRRGAASLADADPAHQILFAAFSWRIDEAEAGRPHGGPLPEPLARRLEGMDKMSRYVVDRLRKVSRILEPEVRANPYRFWGVHRETEGRMAHLQGQSNAEAFQREADRLLASPEGRSPEGRSPEGRSRIGLILLQQSSFGRADQVLAAVREAVSRKDPEGEDGWIDASGGVNAALPAAARFGFRDEVLAMTGRVSRWLSRCGGRRSGFPGLIRSSIDALNAIDGPHGADEFIADVSRAILGDLSPAEWAARVTPADSSGAGILLALAERWYRFGKDDLADPLMRGTLALAGILRVRLGENALAQSQLTGEVVRSLRSASPPVSEEQIKQLLGVGSRFLDSPETEAGDDDELKALASVLGRLTDPGIRPSLVRLAELGMEYGETARAHARLVAGIVPSLRSASRAVAASHIEALFDVLMPWRDTFTTCTYFWGTTLEFVESLCSTAVEICSNG